MARIQLRDATIYLQDGLSGTAAVDDVLTILVGASDAEIDAVVLNTAITDQVPIGARFTFAGGPDIYTVTGRTGPTPTTNIVFTPVKVTPAALDDEVITFLPQRLEIKIGDGDMSWTEARNFEYDLDRDQLDTVRQGEDIPVEVDLAFTFVEVTASTSNPPSPVDALKQIGEASEWVSSSADPCEPYAVDVYVLHCIPCGSVEDQDFLMPDFRYESLEYSMADATIAVSGRCNVTDITSNRGTLC